LQQQFQHQTLRLTHGFFAEDSEREGAGFRRLWEVSFTYQHV